MMIELACLLSVVLLGQAILIWWLVSRLNRSVDAISQANDVLKDMIGLVTSLTGAVLAAKTETPAILGSAARDLLRKKAEIQTTAPPQVSLDAGTQPGGVFRIPGTLG